MDLSNIQPTFKKFDNEQQAEKWLSMLSMRGGKKIDVIDIYPKGSGIYVWFYYDRTKIGYLEGEIKAPIKVTKKKTKKKIKKDS